MPRQLWDAERQSWPQRGGGVGPKHQRLQIGEITAGVAELDSGEALSEKR